MYNNTFYELKKTHFQGDTLSRYDIERESVGNYGDNLVDEKEKVLNYPIKLLTIDVEGDQELKTLLFKYSNLDLNVEQIHGKPSEENVYKVTFKYALDKELEQLVYLFIHKEMSYIDQLESTLSSQKVSLSQYKSLRSNFKKMIEDVLGKCYYNYAHDVYTADQFSCESITRKANRSLWQHFKDSFRETIGKIFAK